MLITHKLSIQADSKKVFDYISNFENNPEWQKGMISCVIEGQVPLGLGQRYKQTARFLGKDIHSLFEVIDFQEDHLVKATTLTSTFPITFTRIVEGNTEHCEVTAIVEGDSSKYYKLFEPIMRIMVKNSIKKDYARLKGIMEA